MVLVGKIGGIDVEGWLRPLGHTLVILVGIGKRELLFGHVLLRVLDAHH
jgi:hypothetical protein